MSLAADPSQVTRDEAALVCIKPRVDLCEHCIRQRRVFRSYFCLCGFGLGLGLRLGLRPTSMPRPEHAYGDAAEIGELEDGGEDPSDGGDELPATLYAEWVGWSGSGDGAG